MRNLYLQLLVGLTAATALSATQADAAPPATAPPSYALAGRVAGPDGGWDYVSFDPDKRRIYVARTDGVTALDVDSLHVIGHLADGKGTHKVIPLRHGAEIAVTNRGDDSVLFIDAESGKLIASVPTAKGPDGALLDPGSGLLLVMTHSGGLGLVDPRTRKAVGEIAVAGAQEEAAVVGDKVYINLEDKGAIAVVSVRERKELKTLPLAGCEGPGGMAYASGAGVLVVACGNNTAKLVRPSDGAIVASVAIGKGPDGAIYDAKRGLAFIPCGRDGVLDVIAVPRDPTHASLVQTVKTELGARTAGLDPKTGHIYLPTAKYDLAHVGAGRFPTVPGTFEILVVAPK